MTFDPSQNQYVNRAGYGSDIDAGLQSHMRSVYNIMGMGLAVTGITAYGVANIPSLAQLIFHTPLVYVAAFAPLAFLWFGLTPQKIMRLEPGAAVRLFGLFSALMGVSMGSLFFIFTAESIARVFFITAAMFAGTSLYGYTTKRDLSRMGSFMIMGAVGIFFAILINMLFHSAAIQFAVSVIGIITFTGLAAWDTQYIKESYRSGGGETNARMAVIGALSMYLNFVNLFQFMLSIMGNRRS